ncbi:MAG: A/G-specific adenine glycosylase [Anaerolineae bacterium]
MQETGSPNELIAQRLIEWYEREHRTLPWRDTTDPYHIWVSEVMLQQTQVVTVVPYYLRFLTRFPTVAVLAEASLDDLLVQWRGLGYYSRARNLHKAAKLICERYGGQVPDTLSALRALPGIGDYSAGAILSIAFGRDIVAIDGNVRRVLCRLFNYAGNPLESAGKRVMHDYAQALLPIGHAGTYNQAMMELGATICSVTSPHCPECPLTADCVSKALGVQEERPLVTRRNPLPRRYNVSALVARDGRYLLVRRIPRGLLGGLWELPGGELQTDEDHAPGLQRILAAHLGIQATVGEQFTTLQHTYTHFLSCISVYYCNITGTPLPAQIWDAARWISPDELAGYGLTGVTVKVLRTIGHTFDH